MNTNTYKYYILISFIAFLAVMFLGYVWLSHTDLMPLRPVVEIVLDADRASMIQLMVKEGEEYNTKQISEKKWHEPVNFYKVSLEIPKVKYPGNLRIDLGASVAQWRIHSITLKGKAGKIEFKGDSILKNFSPNHYFEQFSLEDDNSVVAIVSGHDAYLESNFTLFPLMEKLNNKPFPDLRILFLAFVLAVFVSTLLYYALVKIHPFQYNIVDVMYIIFFGGIISTPVAKMIIAPDEESSENRVLASKPVFTTSNTFTYPSLFNQYLQDNFGFRKELTTLNSYWRFKMLRSSSIPHRVVIGKKSWLFSTDYDIAGDFRNTKLFTQEELEQIRQNLEELYAWYNQRNIKFYIFIAPSKYRIYPEYLPPRLKINQGISKLEQLVEYMQKNSHVKIITAHKQLMNAKKDAEVFYAHDTHWNLQGGFIGYQVLMNEIIADFPTIGILSPDDFDRVKTHHPNADLARMLSLENILLNDEWSFHYKYTSDVIPGKDIRYQTVSPLYPSLFTEHKNTSLPRAVFYRDSFTNLMLPFLMNHFSRACFIWTYEHSVEVTEIEKPDLVVMEIIENRIDRLLEKNQKEFRRSY